MKITTTEIKDIVRLGGSVSVDAAAHTPTELKDIVRLTIGHPNKVILRNTGKLTATELKDIARIGKENVVIEIA